MEGLNGAEFIAEGKGRVSNAWKAKAEPTEFPISADALLNMEADLRKIIAHLEYRHFWRARGQRAPSTRRYLTILYILHGDINVLRR